MNERIDGLLAYMDRLVFLEDRAAYTCTREISECIDAIREELNLGESPDISPKETIFEDASAVLAEYVGQTNVEAVREELAND